MTKPKNPKTIAGTVAAIRKILEDRQRWTKGAYRITVGTNVKFCLVGAARFVDGPFEKQAIEVIHDALPDRWKNRNTLGANQKESLIIDFNDSSSRRHPQILDLLARAQEIAKAKDKENKKK